MSLFDISDIKKFNKVGSKINIFDKSINSNNIMNIKKINENKLLNMEFNKNNNDLLTENKYDIEELDLEKEIEQKNNKIKTNQDIVSIPKDELYSYDENGYVSLKKVHPELEDKIERLIDLCSKEGIPIKITEDLRSVEKQNALYAKGRTTSGNIVTNATGKDYSSFHQWGIAFDICINEVDDAYNIEKLKRVGELGKSIGLEWGGDWTSIVDMPHFQLSGYEDGIQALKEQYQNPADFADTWDFSNTL